jgi:integrase
MTIWSTPGIFNVLDPWSTLYSFGMQASTTTASAAEENARIQGAGYRNDADLVFARPDGSLVNPRSFGTRVVELAERPKVKPITLHCLRDTNARLMAKRGVPLDVISKRLGHASIGITAVRYLHVYQERDALAASSLDNLCD